jgi:hypothetical protein
VRRIHAELKMLGTAISERTVSRILRGLRRPPTQTLKTFLHNHLDQSVSIDFFTVSDDHHEGVVRVHRVWTEKPTLAFRKNRQLKLRHPYSFTRPCCHSRAKLGSTQFPFSSRNHGARSGALNLDTLAERLLDFQYSWEATAKPFEWKFNRKDLNDLLDKLNMPSAKGPVTAPEYVGVFLK